MNANVTWKDDEKGLDKLLKRLRELAIKEVQVGFFDTYYDDDNNGLSVAQVAQWQEEGTQEIPSRPFIRTGFNNEVMSMYKPQVNRMLDKVANGVITPHSACKSFGSDLKETMKLSIEEGHNYKANSASWAAFKARTTGSTTPLIFTGKMRDSVKYQVKSKVVT